MDEEEIHPATRLSPRLTPEITPAKTPENRKPFTDTDRLELITAVKEYPFLYNTKNAWFDENPKRQIAWREIGMMIEQPADTCEEVWRSLVSSFKKYRHRKKEEQILRPWKFDNAMKFLTPYTNIRARTRPQPLTNGIINIERGNIGKKQAKNIQSTHFVDRAESSSAVVNSPKNEEGNAEQGQNIDIRQVNKQSIANGFQQTITKIPDDKTHIDIKQPQQSCSLALNNVNLSTAAVIFDAPEFHVDSPAKIQTDFNTNSKELEKWSVDNTAISDEPMIDDADLPEKEEENNIDQLTANGIEELLINNFNFSEKEQQHNIDTRVLEKQLSPPTTQMAPIYDCLIDKAYLYEEAEEITKKESKIHNLNVEKQFATNDIPLPITKIAQNKIVNLSDTNSKELDKGLAAHTAHKSTMTETAPIDEIDMFVSSIAKTVRKLSPLNKAKAKAKILAVLSEIEMANNGQDENGSTSDVSELFQNLLL